MTYGQIDLSALHSRVSAPILGSMKRCPTLRETLARFATEPACWEHLERMRWPKGAHCPHCGSSSVARWEDKKHTPIFQCRGCRGQFRVTTDTIFADTHRPLTDWFLAMYLLGPTKTRGSVTLLQRSLG